MLRPLAFDEAAERLRIEMATEPQRDEEREADLLRARLLARSTRANAFAAGLGDRERLLVARSAGLGLHELAALEVPSSR